VNKCETMRSISLAKVLLLSLPCITLEDCILQNLQGDMEDTSAIVTWEKSSDCEHGNIKRYEIQWHHKKYKACTDGRGNETLSGVKDDLIGNRAEISGLQPYSIYDFTIKATTRDGTTIPPLSSHPPLQTRMAAPKNQPQDKRQNNPQKTTIFFYWQDPSDCELQNGKREKYKVKLRGMDKWDFGFKLLAENSEVDYSVANSYLAHKLKPYTRYLLEVYNMNFDTQYNRSFVNEHEPLEIQERTLPDRPMAPVNISSSSSTNTSIFLSWSPSYPPTGQIEKFQLRVGNPSSDPSSNPRWTGNIPMEANHKCTHDSNRFCYSVRNLEPGTEYIFQIRAKNLDVSSWSRWSQSLKTQTEADDSTPNKVITTPVIPSVPIPTENVAKINSNTLVIVLCLAGGILLMGVLVTALIYKLKITTEGTNQKRGAVESDRSFEPFLLLHIRSRRRRTSSLYFDPPSRLLFDLLGEICSLWWVSSLLLLDSNPETT